MGSIEAVPTEGLDLVREFFRSPFVDSVRHGALEEFAELLLDERGVLFSHCLP